jgi:hypothetical protein
MNTAVGSRSIELLTEDSCFIGVDVQSYLLSVMCAQGSADGFPQETGQVEREPTLRQHS